MDNPIMRNRPFLIPPMGADVKSKPHHQQTHMADRQKISNFHDYHDRWDSNLKTFRRRWMQITGNKLWSEKCKSHHWFEPLRYRSIRKAEMLMRNMADNAHVMSFMRAWRFQIGKFSWQKEDTVPKNFSAFAAGLVVCTAVDKARPYRLNLPLYLIEISSSGP